MAESRTQGSPSSDSGYSGGASSEHTDTIDVALEILNMDDFTPDQEIELAETGSTGSSGKVSQSSIGTSESGSINSQEDSNKQTLDIWRQDPNQVENSTGKEINGCKTKDKGKKTKIFKRLLSKEKLTPKGIMLDFSKIQVDSLPQVFLTKYLGKRPTHALYGVKHTRKNVEDLVSAVTKLKKNEELPLVILRVSPKGVNIAEHKQNKNKNFEGGLIPIEYISYAVQDVCFFKIFSMIVVRKMSSRKKECECHAWACDSPVSARKLALSVSMAFEEFAKTIKDKKESLFKVDLRCPDDMARDLMHGECDA